MTENVNPTSPNVIATYTAATAAYAIDFRDIQAGSNGGFSAGPGYDMVTGLGSPVASKLAVDPNF